MTPLEIAANAFTAVAIVLAGRNSVHTWWTGIVGCTLFGLLFAQSRLYADVVLHTLAWMLPAGVAAAAGYGALLHHTTNAYAPFLQTYAKLAIPD